MIDTFLKAIENSIALLRERERRRREVFQLVIEPIYCELPELVADNLALVHLAQTALYKLGKTKSPRVATQQHDTLKRSVDAHRQRLKYRRIAVRTFADELAKTSKDDDCRSFAEAVVNLFEIQTKVGPISATQRTVNLVEYLTSVDFREAECRERTHLLGLSFDIERQWINTTRAYVRLKRKFLGIRT